MNRIFEYQDGDIKNYVREVFINIHYTKSVMNVYIYVCIYIFDVIKNLNCEV